MECHLHDVYRDSMVTLVCLGSVNDVDPGQGWRGSRCRLLLLLMTDAALDDDDDDDITLAYIMSSEF